MASFKDIFVQKGLSQSLYNDSMICSWYLLGRVNIRFFFLVKFFSKICSNCTIQYTKFLLVYDGTHLLKKKGFSPSLHCLQFRISHLQAGETGRQCPSAVIWTEAEEKGWIPNESSTKWYVCKTNNYLTTGDSWYYVSILSRGDYVKTDTT